MDGIPRNAAKVLATWARCAGVAAVGMLGLVGVILVAGPLTAAEPETAWRVDFDSADEVGGVHYVVRGGKDTDEGMRFEIADGVLTFGAEFDDTSAGYDHGVLSWGESMPWGFWQWKSSPFKKIDATQYPIVEVRARKAPGIDAAVTLAPTFDTDVGRKFAQLGLQLSDEWQTLAFRFSPFSRVPGASTPREVTGMVFWVQHNRRPSGLEIDWVRVRAFTPEEKAKDDVIVDVLGSYKVREWKQPFFVYGPYGPSIRGTACQGGFEGAYGDMVRAHMNYVMCPHDISYYRFQGRDGKTQEENVADFLEVNRRAVEAAADAGLALSLDVRGFAKDFDEHGIDYIRPGVRLVANAFRNNETVLGYTVDDEPNSSRLVEVVAVKKLFEEADPDKLCAFPINDPFWTQDFDPYTTILAPDRYPITLEGRNPEAVAGVLEEYLAASKKPLWFIAQAIGQKAWWPQKPGNYAMPTEAEFRRMAFMALGRGAKGLMFFDWYHRPWQTLVDRYGNPGPLYETAKSLGGRLAAVGSILLSARYDAEFSRSFVSDKAAKPFEVFALRLEDPPATVCVAGNTDLEHAHDFGVPIPPCTLGTAVIELETFEVNADALHAQSVSPGDGRLFAITNEEGIRALKAEVLANRRREAERVARPDRVIAERWGGASDEMNAIDADLDACAAGLGDIEKKVSAGVKVPRKGMESQWNRCMALAKTYDSLRSRWIGGDREGLAEAAASLARDVTVLTKGVLNQHPSGG